MGAKNTMTITTLENALGAELMNQSVCAGPYKQTDAAITREFMALQSRVRAADVVTVAPNWFGVPAGVFATLRRANPNGSGKIGKNGWTAELLIESVDGSYRLASGIGAGFINSLPSTDYVRIVNVKPADAVTLTAHYTQTQFVRGSQRLPNADRNPATGVILKPDVVTEPAPPAESTTNVVTEPAPPAESTTNVVTEPAFKNRKTRRAGKR
jgi:hypothetical protein